MSAFAAGKTKKYDKYINYRDPLTHTYNRLKNDKELNIVYFGGSVTAGYGSTNAAYSWRGLSMKWFSEKFPDANINFINTAIGESGTYLGTFRVKQDVINKNPDLLFIEYAINDTYKGSSKDQAALQYETIVREVRTALPNCDIVTLLVTDKERSKSLPELYPTAAGHEKIAKAYPEMYVGAGTVITMEEAKKAVEAGAKFIVSPGLDLEIVEFAKANNIEVYPGCVTPTEIQAALKAGLDVVKFFPAAQFGGIKTIKALSGPFAKLQFMPTGGISLDNLEEYISTKNIIACGGSFMVKESFIEEENWDEITRQCKEARAIVDKVRK